MSSLACLHLTHRRSKFLSPTGQLHTLQTGRFSSCGRWASQERSLENSCMHAGVATEYSAQPAATTAVAAMEFLA